MLQGTHSCDPTCPQSLDMLLDPEASHKYPFGRIWTHAISQWLMSPDPMKTREKLPYTLALWVQSTCLTENSTATCCSDEVRGCTGIHTKMQYLAAKWSGDQPKLLGLSMSHPSCNRNPKRDKGVMTNEYTNPRNNHCGCEARTDFANLDNHPPAASSQRTLSARTV